MGKIRKWMVALIAVAVLCVMLPVVASAEIIASGTCGANGDNVTWVLDNDGTLTISGTGAMEDYGYPNYSPWYEDIAIQHVKIENGITHIGNAAFYFCRALTSVSIASTVTDIGESAFSSSGLTSVTIPESVRSIGQYAFYHTNLTSVTIPSTVTYLDDAVFSGCTNLTSATIAPGLTSISDDLFANCVNLTSVTIPEGVTSIGWGAFRNCGLISVTLPSTLTTIGGSAFDSVSSLTNVTIHDGVTYIGPRAFYNTALTSVTIPSSVKEMNIQAFANCKALTSVTIEPGLTSISEKAFEYCSSLKKISIPSTVTSIEPQAFSYCESLTSVTIPSGVKSIGDQAFESCSALTNLTIPSSVTSIGSYAYGYAAAYDNVDYARYAGVTITGVPGTAAETYAKNNDIPFIAMTANLDTPQITSVTSSGTSVTVKWGAVSGAEMYRLFYKKDGKWTKLRDTTATSVTITGGTPGKTYTYTVRCINSAGTTYASDYDKTGKSITLDLLATPKITSVTADGAKVTVTWGKVTGAEMYRLFYKKDGKWTTLKDTTGTSVTLNGTMGKTYTYTVRCINSAGTAYTSAYDTTGTSITLKQLATPKISSVTGNAGSVVIKWGAVSGAAKYRVFYKNGSSWKKIADSTSTSYTWTAAEAGKSHTFTVRCVSSDGTTFTSNYDTTGTSYTVPGGTLSTPKISSVNGNAGSVVIKWGAVTGAAKYRVFYKGDTGWKKIADTTSTSYTWAAAAANTTYTFTVRCVSSDGSTFTSAYDTTGTSYTVPSGKLATPKLSTVTYDATGVTLKWGSVSGAAKYRVFYKTSGSTSWKKIADTTSTSYTWKGATNGTKYTFTVRCVSADGSTFTSDYDTTGKTITYTTTLGTPKISGVSGNAGNVTIKWGAVAGAAKYRVFYRTSSGWKKIADTTSTSYTWTGATAGTYTFTVRCVTSDGSAFTSNYDTTGVSFTAK